MEEKYDEITTIQGVPFEEIGYKYVTKNIHPSIYKGYRKPFYEKVESDEGTVYKLTDSMSDRTFYEDSEDSAKRSLLAMKANDTSAIKNIYELWGFSGAMKEEPMKDTMRVRETTPGNLEEIVDFEAGLYLLRNFPENELYPVIYNLSKKFGKETFPDFYATRNMIADFEKYSESLDAFSKATRDCTTEMYHLIVNDPETLNLNLAASLIDTEHIKNEYENTRKEIYS